MKYAIKLLAHVIEQQTKLHDQDGIKEFKTKKANRKQAEIMYNRAIYISSLKDGQNALKSITWIQKTNLAISIQVSMQKKRYLKQTEKDIKRMRELVKIELKKLQNII